MDRQNFADSRESLYTAFNSHHPNAWRGCSGCAFLARCGSNEGWGCMLRAWPAACARGDERPTPPPLTAPLFPAPRRPPCRRLPATRRPPPRLRRTSWPCTSATRRATSSPSPCFTSRASRPCRRTASHTGSGRRCVVGARVDAFSEPTARLCLVWGCG